MGNIGSVFRNVLNVAVDIERIAAVIDPFAALDLGHTGQAPRCLILGMIPRKDVAILFDRLPLLQPGRFRNCKLV